MGPSEWRVTWSQFLMDPQVAVSGGHSRGTYLWLIVTIYKAPMEVFVENRDNQGKDFGVVFSPE
jgi:hypothetical protein